MKLSKKTVRGVTVVTIQGKLIGGPGNSEQFHAFFKTLIDEGQNRLVVNLRRVSWANSQGIGMLIGAYSSARKAGGDLVLARVLDRVEGILNVTRLYLIFRVFDSAEEAIRHLSGKPDSDDAAQPHNHPPLS